MIINQTKYLNFKSAKSPSGSDWYYVSRTNDKKGSDSAVVITTVVKHKGKYCFLFLKTKRPPILAENKAKWCLESPAGLIADENKKEGLIECAKKELLEEGGYIAEDIFIELTNSSTSAGLSSETLSYVSAFVEDDTLHSPPVSDNGIIEDRIFVPVDDVFEYINSLDKSEVSVSSCTVCGLYFALNRIN